MASKKKYFKTPSISLIKQKVSLKNAYKDSECVIEGKKLIWTGKVRPTVLSKEYTLIILYEFKKSPKVWITGDELERIDDKNFPHIYDRDIKNNMVRICLYMNSEFNSSKLLANTIIPWAIEWLYYYEIWLLTDEWLGGGRHPQNGSKKNDKQGEI